MLECVGYFTKNDEVEGGEEYFKEIRNPLIVFIWECLTSLENLLSESQVDEKFATT